MTLKTVGDVLLGITAGKSLKTLDRPALPHEVGILKISAVTWGTFRAEENKAMPIDFDANGIPRAMSGDILISRANTRELVGAPVMVDKDYRNLLLSDKLLKLIPNEDLVDPRYLLHSLRSEKSRIHFSKCAGGTSGSMTNITQGDIRSAPLHLPSLEEQRRIAAILDKAESLRAKRREAIAKLDQLLQSVFLEIFGDPIENSKKWPSKKLGEFIKFTGGSQPPKETFIYEPQEGFVRLVQIRDFRTDKFPTYIPRKLARRIFEKDDIMIGRYGPPVFQILRGLSGSYNVALMKAEPLIDIEKEYIFHLLRNKSIQDLVINNSQRSAGQTGVNLDFLNKISVGLPPKNLQSKFAEFSKAIERIKPKNATSLEKIEELIASAQSLFFK